MANSFIGGDQYDSIVSKGSSLATRVKGGISSITSDASEVDKTQESTFDESGLIAKSLTYPRDLQSSSNHSNFMIFRAYDLNSSTRAYYGKMRTNFSSREKGTTADTSAEINSELMTTIALYAPNLIEEISHEFDKYSSNPIADLISNAMSSGSDVAKGNISAGAENLGDAAMEATGAIIANAEQGFAGKARANALAKDSVVLRDAVSTTAYKTTAKRTQTFLYTFAPKSLAELKDVGNIIKAFYALSLPTPASHTRIPKSGVASFDRGVSKYSAAYKTPPVWMIEEVSDIPDAQRHTPRFMFGPAGITAVRLNKTPDQYWRTFQGTAGDSATIEMEITFQELVTMNRDTYTRDMASSVNGYGG